MKKIFVSSCLLALIAMVGCASNETTSSSSETAVLSSDSSDASLDVSGVDKSPLTSDSTPGKVAPVPQPVEKSLSVVHQPVKHRKHARVKKHSKKKHAKKRAKKHVQHVKAADPVESVEAN